jgi:hypothetical protein
MLLWLLAMTAQAQDTTTSSDDPTGTSTDDDPTPPPPEPTPPEPTPPPPEPTPTISAAATEGTTPKPEWAYAPYVQPILDFTIYDPGGLKGAYTIVNLGLEGGVHYHMKGDQIPTWAGRTRVSGYYGFGGDGVQSWELRAGSFIGPVFDRLSLETGLDIFGNQLTVDGDGLVPSAGIDVPLLARLDLTIPSVWGGIGTAYMFDKERRVDWSETDQFGFGHEFQYIVGAGVKAGIRLSVEYTHRIVVTGDEETIMLGAGI